MTRPSGETNEPEPPLLKRTDDFWTCSSHWSVTSKPYLSLRYLRGGLLNSHMPSSPWTAATEAARTRRARTGNRNIFMAGVHSLGDITPDQPYRDSSGPARRAPLT